MNGPMRFLLVVAGVTVVSLSGMLLGLWWVTFPAALVAGLALPRTVVALVAGAVAGVVAWSEPLLFAQTAYGLAPTATVLAAIMGVKGAALVPIALTVVTGVLLGLSGAWLGAAARAVVISLRRSPAVEKLGDQRLEVKDSVLTKG